jgi:hypothetical protein
VGFSRQFTGGFEDVAGARELERDAAHPGSVAGRSLELFDALARDWDSSTHPDRSGHVVWFELEA